MKELQHRMSSLLPFIFCGETGKSYKSSPPLHIILETSGPTNLKISKSKEWLWTFDANLRIFSRLHTLGGTAAARASDNMFSCQLGIWHESGSSGCHPLSCDNEYRYYLYCTVVSVFIGCEFTRFRLPKHVGDQVSTLDTEATSETRQSTRNGECLSVGLLRFPFLFA